jgi:hypothetical protein
MGYHWEKSTALQGSFVMVYERAALLYDHIHCLVVIDLAHSFSTVAYCIGVNMTDMDRKRVANSHG